jgi:hypothetical protein
MKYTPEFFFEEYINFKLFCCLKGQSSEILILFFDIYG